MVIRDNRTVFSYDKSTSLNKWVASIIIGHNFHNSLAVSLENPISIRTATGKEKGY
jgi:hypothetical protein